MYIKSLHDYIKISKIGTGSFGQVYKIKEKQTGKLYAAKVSYQSIDELSDNYRLSILDFEREISLVSRIHHPLILNFVGLSLKNFKGENNPTIITDYIPNGSLNNIKKVTKTTDWNETTKLINIYGIASVMSFLHSNNIIHLDLKPSHILLNENLYPIITDFGFSIDLNEVSNIYEIRGTPLYISPEIYEDSNYSKKSDVYSYALILYEILTSEVPFKKMSLYQLTQAVCEGERPDVSSIKEPYKNLIERCWQQEPTKRPSFDQIVNEIETNNEYITDLIDEEKFKNFVNYIKNCSKSFDDASTTEKFDLNFEIMKNIESNEIDDNEDEYDYEKMEKEIESLRNENRELKEKNRQLTDENSQLKSSSLISEKSIEIEFNCSENYFLPKKYLTLTYLSLFLGILFIVLSLFCPFLSPLIVVCFLFFFYFEKITRSFLDEKCHSLAPKVISYLENECKEKTSLKSEIKRKFNVDDHVMKHLADALRENGKIFIDNTKDNDQIWKLN